MIPEFTLIFLFQNEHYKICQDDNNEKFVINITILYSPTAAKTMKYNI